MNVQRFEAARNVVAILEVFLTAFERGYKDFALALKEKHVMVQIAFTKICALWITELAATKTNDERLQPAIELAKRVADKVPEIHGPIL